MNSSPAKRIIIDKSFLQAEPRDCRRLSVLAEAGFQFVCIDTLGYEFATGNGEHGWAVAQRKLARYTERVEFWWHASDLITREIQDGLPIQDPCDHEVTERVRQHWLAGEMISSPDFEAIIKKSHGEREVDSVVDLRRFYEVMLEGWPNAATLLSREVGAGNPVNPTIREALRRSSLVPNMVRHVHGDPEKSDLYLTAAEQGLNCDWFLYRNLRAMLALAFLLMAKYGQATIPEKELANTKLDLDYLEMIHFADGIATNETSGLMADLFEVLHGRSKIKVSAAEVERCQPSIPEVAEGAYFRWLNGGCLHGNDFGDWLAARADLVRQSLAKITGQQSVER